MVSVVAANAPLEDLQHGFDWNWVVEHRERAIAQGLGGLFAGTVQSHQQTTSRETSRSSRTEQVNGKDVDGDEAEEDERPTKKKQQASKERAPSRFAFGATCQKIVGLTTSPLVLYSTGLVPLP
jgi:hypothetical protein